MALVNPNIAMSFRAPEIQQPNVLADYAALQQIQGGRQTQELNALKMQQAQKEIQTQNVLGQAYAQSVDPVTGKIDYNKLTGLVAAGGGGAQLPGIQKSRLETQTSELTFAEARRKFMDKVKLDLSSNPSDDNVRAFGQDAVIQGIYPREVAEREVAQLLAMPPEKRAQLLAQSGATVSERKPTVSVGPTGIVQTPAFGGPATVVSGTEAAFGITPAQAQANQIAQQRLGLEGQRVGLERERVGIARTEAERKAAEKPMTPAQSAKRRDQLGKEFKVAQNALQTTQDVLDSIAFVKAEPGLSRATGFTGTMLPSFPEGAAASAETRLKNLEGKITALGKAQASATGAIGSIATQEWQVLRDQIAAIDRSKGTGPLLAQLELVEQQAQGALERMKDAYQRQFSEDFERFPQFADLPAPKSTFKAKTPAGAAPAPAGGAAPAPAANIEAILKKYP